VRACVCVCVCAGHAEFDYDDSDRSSVYSTPSPQTRQFQTLAAGGGSSVMMSAGCRQPVVYHPSLRKKRWFERHSSAAVSTGTGRQVALEKSWSLQADRPLSLLTPPYYTESNVIANKVADTLLQQVCSLRQSLVSHKVKFQFNLIQFNLYSCCYCTL